MHGAKLDTPDANEQTPLFHAVNEAHGECAKMLLLAGAREDAVDVDGRTPLHWAAAAGSMAMCMHLLDHDAPPDAADEKGVQPIHEAAAQGHTEVLTSLIAAGASPDAADHSGTRALHWAALTGSTAMCTTLLEAGAHINAPDYATPRCTAADFAVRAGEDAIDCHLLLQKNAALPWRKVGEREREECWIELGEEYDPKPDADVLPTVESTAVMDPEATASRDNGEEVSERPETPVEGTQGKSRRINEHTIVAPNMDVPTSFSPSSSPSPKPTVDQQREAGWDGRLSASMARHLIERKPIRPLPGNKIERKPDNFDVEAPGLVGPLTMNRGVAERPRVAPSRLGSAQLRARLAERDRELKTLKDQYSQMVGRTHTAPRHPPTEASAGLSEHVQALKKTLAEALTNGKTDPDKQRQLKAQLKLTLGDVKALKASTEEISKLLMPTADASLPLPN
jgi:hypothetical protein